ncbi:MAG: GIY-YIG nuclease family protein [Bacteroidota bacterium]
MYSYYVYIIKCCDQTYYTGITNNISKRFTEHTNGIDKFSYTFRRRPLSLEFVQEFNDVLQAIRFEKKLKKWTRAKKKALIYGDDLLLNIISDCLNATHYKYNPLK